MYPGESVICDAVAWVEVRPWQSLNLLQPRFAPSLFIGYHQSLFQEVIWILQDIIVNTNQLLIIIVSTHLRSVWLSEKKKKKSDSKGCNLQKARALQLVLSQMSIPKSAQQLWSALNDQILSSCCLEMFRDYGCFCRDVILEVHDRCKNHCSP